LPIDDREYMYRQQPAEIVHLQKGNGCKELLRGLVRFDMTSACFVGLGSGEHLRELDQVSPRFSAATTAGSRENSSFLILSTCACGAT
jgi:hypothetical protein